MDEVKFYMTQDIIGVKATATGVAQKMLDAGQGSVLIEEDREYIEIVTEGDLS
jgi:hypothetical protein